jgi:hypothetical protein
MVEIKYPRSSAVELKEWRKPLQVIPAGQSTNRASGAHSLLPARTWIDDQHWLTVVVAQCAIERDPSPA